jgi:hypothetical protein
VSSVGQEADLWSSNCALGQGAACEALRARRGPTAEAIGYALNHWDGLVRFLDHSRIEIDSNAVEHSRPEPENALFADSDEGRENFATAASLAKTCKLNAVDPQRYFAELLTRLINRWPSPVSTNPDASPRPTTANRQALTSTTTAHAIYRAIVPNNLRQVAARAPEHIDIAGMGTTLQRLPNLQCEAILGATHICCTRRERHTQAGGGTIICAAAATRCSARQADAITNPDRRAIHQRDLDRALARTIVASGRNRLGMALPLLSGRLVDNLHRHEHRRRLWPQRFAARLASPAPVLISMMPSISDPRGARRSAAKIKSRSTRQGTIRRLSITHIVLRPLGLHGANRM